MELTAAVDTIASAIDAITGIDVSPCEPSPLRSELARLKILESRLGAQIGRITHAADTAGAFIGTGAKDTAEWLGKQTGTSTRKNRTAAELGEAMSKSDSLADAVTSGDVSTDKASIVVGAAAGETVDQTLLDMVADLSLKSIKPVVEDWVARNHPERDEDIADTQRSKRYLRLTSQPDGMTRIDGLLDPESGAIVRATLDGIISQSAFDNTGRRRDQRCHDALTQLCVAASKGEIAGGRSNTKLLVTVPFETVVERAAARGHSHVGPTLDAATVRKLACDAGIHRIITGPASSLLDFGHETRLVPDNLFLALVARDRHCRWPGCTIRATWCDAHHIKEWIDLGPTSDTNCVLLCHRHHQLSHQPGWHITGTANELRIKQPDGTLEISRPPHHLEPALTKPACQESGRTKPVHQRQTRPKCRETRSPSPPNNSPSPKNARR